MSKKNVTFVITEELDRNIELCATIERKQKSQVLNEALEPFFATKEYLKNFQTQSLQVTSTQAQGRTTSSND
jgi:hypothetical protein